MERDWSSYCEPGTWNKIPVVVSHPVVGTVYKDHFKELLSGMEVTSGGKIRTSSIRRLGLCCDNPKGTIKLKIYYRGSASRGRIETVCQGSNHRKENKGKAVELWAMVQLRSIRFEDGGENVTSS